MKLVKRTLIISAFAFLPAAILATQHSKNYQNLFHLGPSAEQQTNIQVPVKAVPAATLSKVAVNNLSIVSDISPNRKNQAALKKTWLKNTQVRDIIKKAQKNGQLFYVMNRLEKMQLPKSLALIPIIESQYKNTAKSNKGAGGIWQLMPGTARQLGIKSNERFQLAQSTNAALKYFKSLHQQFGNWELAIAAYNAGDGRVRHALHLNPNAKNVQDLKLPQETKQYVLKFYALENYISKTNAQA